MKNIHSKNPTLIAVAPNGARYSKSDHPALPISPRELAETAADCAEAGAAMIHLHVRDARGRHSLEPSHYRPAIEAIRKTVGDAMLIQLTTEAAGVYQPAAQMRLIDELAPEGLSISVAIRELFADDPSIAAASVFLSRLQQRGNSIQYIFYNLADVRHYRQLLTDGIIPAAGYFRLFVLGRYPHGSAPASKLEDYLAEFDDAVPWMACAFGSDAVDRLGTAAALGGHVRIGFENGWLLPDGSIAADNASLVRALAARIRESRGEVAPITELHRFLIKR